MSNWSVDDYMESIDLEVQEGRHVDFKWVASRFSCPTIVAKKMLYSYATKNKKECSCMYYISGVDKRTKIQTIFIVSDKKRVKVLDELDPVLSQHVYSVSKNKPSTITDIYNADSQAMFVPKDHGAINYYKGEVELRKMSRPASKPISNIPPPTTVKQEAKETNVKKEKAAQKGMASLFSKNATPSTSSTPQKQSSTTNNENDHDTPAKTKKKAAASKPKKSVNKKRKQRDEQESEESDLVMDEEDDAMDEDTPNPSPVKKEKESPQKQSSSSSNTVGVKKEAKTRLVKKQVFTTNEEGYRVASDEWVTEEVPAEEEETPPTPQVKKSTTASTKKTTPPKKKTSSTSANAKATPKQGSITSFFNKK
ncbi:hypothetical protein AKO1_007854 [Acrasis kona]|uniref:DNA polymerase delta subunit 3 n=1 Tax=Acrasis kona TaxID=1008807 RepID=A0AAW2YQ56_9EUKA